MKIITTNGVETVENMDGLNLLKSTKYRAEVTGIGEYVWSSNAMEYDTEDEAKAWLDGLSMRWFGYDLSRVVTVDTPQRQKVNFETDNFYQKFRKL